MNLPRVDRRRFPNLGRKVVLYVVLAMLSIAGLVLAVGYRQGLLQGHIHVFFYTPDATGISKGMPVKFLGFSVGSVNEMRIRPAEVEINLTITGKYAEFVPHGSQARLSREGLIGASFIEIVPNRDAGGRSLAENEVIRFERRLGPSEMAEDLKHRVEPVVAGMKQTIDWINSPEGDVRQSLVTTRNLIQSVSQSQERVAEFMQHATATASTVRESVDVVARFAQNTTRVVGDEMPKIATSATAAMQEVAAAARELNRATRSTRERMEDTNEKVSEAVSDAQGVVSDAGEIAQALKRSWPFNRVIGAPQIRTLPIDINDSPTPWPKAPVAPREKAE